VHQKDNPNLYIDRFISP